MMATVIKLKIIFVKERNVKRRVIHLSRCVIKSGNDDRNIVDDRADKNNFHLTADNNKQCDVNNIHKELDAQGSTSNLTLDALSQVMTNSSLDNETAVNLNSQDELSGSSSQLSRSVFQNDVHSTQVVNKSRDGTVKPANLVSKRKRY